MLRSLVACRWLHVCLGFIMVQSILSDCSFPPKNMTHGEFILQSPDDVNLANSPDNYVLRFKCLPGYTLIGPYIIICYQEQWSDIVPTCVEMECSCPPNIKNSKGELHAGINNLPTAGSTVVYACNMGYELLNATSFTLTCVLDEISNTVSWDGEMPVCKEKISCPDPGVSKDGEREGNCCLSGSVLQFSCNEDYELVGHSEIECLSTGIWTFGRPLCTPVDVHCPLPLTIPHGVLKGSNLVDYYLPYDEVEVLCEPGYSYQGLSEFILCEEEGEWEMEFGNCTETFCDLPEPLANGTILELQSTNITRFPFNFLLSYVCDKGFRLVGGDSWRFCDTVGWSSRTPYCEAILCPDPGVPNYGAREADDFEVGSKVYFKCFTGYYLIGSFERYCMPNGQWTGELTRCDTESNYCPDPGVPINAFKNSSSYDKGDIVGFRCRAGYTQLGSEARECLPSRTWSGQETKCLGPYDFDNHAQIGDSLKAMVNEKAAEQERMLMEFQQHSEAMGPRGRSLNINPSERLILYFLFDVSGSVGRENFRKSIAFAKAIVKKIGISPNGARAGAITFSSKTEEQFLPMHLLSTETVLYALEHVNYTGGGTSASSALSELREKVIPLTHRYLGVTGLKSVLFILTDGRANMGGDPREEADLLKKAGLEIYCIGITGTYRKDTLYKIASDPKEEHVFILKDYAEHDYIIQKIITGTIDYSPCGLGLKDAGNQARARILGGERADEPWPWMAALYFSSPGNLDKAVTQIQCGGSIIHPNFILTAAHCMYYVYDKKQKLRTVENVFVKLGLTHVENETFVQEPEVKKIHLHPKYKIGLDHDYDIALLQLNNPIEYNHYVRPICLPPEDLSPTSTFYKAKQHGLVAGWGHQGIVTPGQTYEDDLPEELRKLIIPIQSRERCNHSLAETSHMYFKYFTDRMFCAGDEHEGNDTCYGDSGGPFMQSQLNVEGNIYWTQVGIVSWGIGCGRANSYGYYTHVQKLRDWIDKTIENEIMTEDKEV